MYRVYALILVLVLIGCTTTSGRQITAAEASSFKNGETTADEVIAKLGPPRTDTTTKDGVRTIIYVFVESKSRPENFVPIVGLVAGGVDQKSSSMYFIFEPNGKLRTSKATEYQPQSRQFIQ